uniref:Prominin-1-like isoform X1 n=1 Tax=Crassostrea virginica TaxID=6565 RepID=A0A8B8CFY4_CRAVI|nr:prominin-1-like isoform X1 [Crassostrea virginica]
MKRFVLVLAFVSSTVFVINGENSTDDFQTGPASLGEESALEKGAKPLFNLVHGFLDSVQEYDFITDNSSAKITYKNVVEYIDNGTYDKFQDRWQDLVAVFGGFAACVVVGLLFAIFMPIIGLFFCCCYCCCKRCGKAREKTDPKAAGCKRATFCIFLAVFATLMLTGGIVSIIANELLHNKLQNSDQRGPVQYWRSGLSNIISYGDTTADDLEKQTKAIVFKTIREIQTQINDSVPYTVRTVQSAINASELLYQTEQLGTKATQVYSNLQNISSTLEELKSLQNNLSTKITEINQNFTNTCNGSANPILSSNCPNLPDVANDFTVVGNLTTEIEKVSKSLNISELTEEARKQFDQVVNDVYTNADVTKAMNDANNRTAQIENDINREIDSLTGTVKKFTNNIKGNTTQEINKIDNYFKDYADYIWYGGLGIPSVIFLTVVFYFLGILFGLCGQRPGHGAPCCNRGAGSNFFVGGVVWTFFIFWILMYILMIMFLVGGLLYTNVCRNLNKGVEHVADYEGIMKKLGIDIKDLLDYSSSSNFSIKNALGDCKENKGIYLALDLQDKFDLDALMNTTEIEKNIKEISQTGITVKNITILSESLNKSLSDFANSGISGINFTSYEEQLDKTPIANLSGIIAEFNKFNLTTQVEIVTALQDQEINAFNQKMRELREVLNVLMNQTQTELQEDVRKLQALLKQSEDTFNSEKDDLIATGLNNTVFNVTNIVKDGIQQAKNETKDLGKCKPLYNAAQGMSDSVCVVMLDPFNMFWFGIGWGIFFSIPSIIFALLLANMYQREEKFDRDLYRIKKESRQKPQQQDFDSPMMETYQDNIPLTSPPNRGYGRSNNGEVNSGYNNDRRDDYHRGNQYRDDYRHDDYRHDDYRGSHGDPSYRQGERDYPPPSYHDSRHYPSPGYRDAYPVLPQKNRY